MSAEPITVLFLCTGNSARSILAEALLNDLGQGRFKAMSAGRHPAGQVNPGALEKLSAEGHTTGGLASKSWESLSGPGAPEFDMVITVCDTAAGETCPLWNGSPVVAHWGIPDPAAETDEVARRDAFDRAYSRLKRRIVALLGLPLRAYDDATCAEALQRLHTAALADDALDA